MNSQEMEHDIWVNERAKENPFYDNHIFSRKDIERAMLKLNWLQRLILFFAPTFVQVSDGYAWYFKIGRDGCHYLIKYDKIYFKEQP